MYRAAVLVDQRCRRRQEPAASLAGTRWYSVLCNHFVVSASVMRGSHAVVDALPFFAFFSLRFPVHFVFRGLPDQGVCHRDLKPENLLLDADFNLKVFSLTMIACLCS